MASAIVGFWTIVSTFAVSSAEVIHVPAEQPTIQAAIEIAADGDTILVAPGTYVAEGKAEEVVNLLGKSIRLESTDGPQATIIDGENRSRGLLCNSGEGLETVVVGFTFTNCRKADGAGANFSDASPLIRNCTFSLNNGRRALHLENSSAQPGDRASSAKTKMPVRCRHLTPSTRAQRD